MASQERIEAIREQLQIKKFWKGFLFFWYVLHYLLGVSAVFISVTIAARPTALGLSEQSYGNLAWILALCTGSIAFLSPEQSGYRYQRAFRILSSEITRYLADETYPVKNVVDAYNRGEDIIHQASVHDRKAR
jgi:hypothetical protein